MSKNPIKKSIFSRIRNNFIAGVVALIPIGITLYLTLFIIKLSEKLIPTRNALGAIRPRQDQEWRRGRQRQPTPQWLYHAPYRKRHS